MAVWEISVWETSVWETSLLEMLLMEEASELVGRIAPPSDYLFKIKSFSLFTKASVEKFQSDDFETGGCKWRLWIYPTGKKSRDEKEDYISLYLELIETTFLPPGWEVNAVSRFFVFDHLRNKYFTTKDVLETRYHAMNTTSATVEFIPLDTFSNPANGYILDDDCVFGVEIFIVKCTAKTGCVSMIPEPGKCYHTWKVCNFSSFGKGRSSLESLPPGDGSLVKGNNRVYFETPKAVNTEQQVKLPIDSKSKETGVEKLCKKVDEAFTSIVATQKLTESIETEVKAIKQSMSSLVSRESSVNLAERNVFNKGKRKKAVEEIEELEESEEEDEYEMNKEIQALLRKKLPTKDELTKLVDLLKKYFTRVGVSGFNRIINTAYLEIPTARDWILDKILKLAAKK